MCVCVCLKNISEKGQSNKVNSKHGGEEWTPALLWYSEYTLACLVYLPHASSAVFASPPPFPLQLPVNPTEHQV